MLPIWPEQAIMKGFNSFAKENSRLIANVWKEKTAVKVINLIAKAF